MGRGLKVVLGVAAVAVIFLAVVLITDSIGGDKIADGIRIGTLDAGGLDAETARERVQRELGAAVRRPVQVTHGRQSFVLRADKAGVRVDAGATVDAALERSREGSALSRLFGGGTGDATIAPRISYPRAKLEGFVARVARRVDRSGVKVDQDEFLKGLVRTISNPARGGRTLEIPVTGAQ